MPARIKEIKKALVEYGYSIEKPKGGSHWKVVGHNKTYPLAAHNAERSEINDYYIRKMCIALEIDYEKFCQDL